MRALEVFWLEEVPDPWHRRSRQRRSPHCVGDRALNGPEASAWEHVGMRRVPILS